MREPRWLRMYRCKVSFGPYGREKKRVHLPAGMGGKEPRKPQLCRMAEGNFSELFGRTQAKKGNFGFLASERQKENFRVTFPGEARRWRKEILRAETVPGVVDIYIYYTFICFLISSPLLSFVSVTLLTIQSLIPSFFFPHHLKSGARRSTGSSFFVLFPASHMTRGIDIVE